MERRKERVRELASQHYGEISANIKDLSNRAKILGVLINADDVTRTEAELMALREDLKSIEESNNALLLRHEKQMRNNSVYRGQLSIDEGDLGAKLIDIKNLVEKAQKDLLADENNAQVASQNLLTPEAVARIDALLANTNTGNVLGITGNVLDILAIKLPNKVPVPNKGPVLN